MILEIIFCLGAKSKRKRKSTKNTEKKNKRKKIKEKRNKNKKRNVKKRNKTKTETEKQKKQSFFFDFFSSTLLGVKIVDIHSNKLIKVIGKFENTERFLSICLFQGTEPKTPFPLCSPRVPFLCVQGRDRSFPLLCSFSVC